MSVLGRIAELIDPAGTWDRRAKTARAGRASSAILAPERADDVAAFERRFAASEFVEPNRRGKAVYKRWDSTNAARDGLKASTWVYACIYKLAKSLAAIHWTAERRVGEAWVHEPKSKLQALLDAPNEDMSRQTFAERIGMSLYLGGNAIIRKHVSVGGGVRQMWPVPPHKITPILGDPDMLEGLIKAYDYALGGGKKDRWDADEIVHIMFTDPDDEAWGMAPIQAAARAIDTDVEAVNFNKVSLQNRAIVDGILSFERGLSDAQYDKIKRQWRDRHQGARNANNPAILGGAVKWTPISMTPTELDFLESRRFTREEICAVFQVPPPVVGIYDNATLANIQTARLIFWEDTMIPLAEDIAEALTLGVASHYGPGWRVSYDVSHISVLLEIFAKKIEQAARLFSMGVPMVQINAILKLGLEAYAGWDQGLVPAGLVPTNFAAIDSLFGGDGEGS